MHLHCILHISITLQPLQVVPIPEVEVSLLSWPISSRRTAPWAGNRSPLNFFLSLLFSLLYVGSFFRIDFTVLFIWLSPSNSVVMREKEYHHSTTFVLFLNIVFSKHPSCNRGFVWGSIIFSFCGSLVILPRWRKWTNPSWGISSVNWTRNTLLRWVTTSFFFSL